MIRSLSRLLALGVVLMLLGGADGLSQRVRAADAGSVTVRLHSCPGGFDGINASASSLAQSCTAPIGGVVFTLHFGNVYPSRQTDVDGSWQLTGVPSGPITLTESPLDPSLLIRAICSQFDASAGANAYQEAPAGQGSLSWNLEDGQAIDCDWYNFPAVSVTPASVIVRVHDCPGAFDAVNASFNSLAANCQGTPSGLTFTLNPSSGPPRGGQTDASGFISWQGIPHGSIAIAEVPPGDRDVFRVFCNQRAETGGELGFTELPVSASASISDTIKDDYSEYDCDWFNAASIQPGAVTVTKYDCPASASDPTAISDLLQVCTRFANATFNLTPSSAGASLPMATNDQGVAQWTGLSADQFQLREELPGGYGAPSVACKIGDPNSSPAQQMDVTGGPAISFTLTAGQSADCIWFNFPSPPTPTPTATAIPTTVVSGNPPTNTTPAATSRPAGPATLTIVTFTCDPGYNVFAKNADPAADCPETAAGVQFALSGGGAAKKLKTGDDGKAVFSNLKGGVFSLVETFPTGVTSAFIDSCGSNLRDFRDYPFNPFARVGSSGTIGVTLNAGERLTCAWYDVPSKGSLSSGATVTITLKDCSGQSVVLAQCGAGRSGVTFTLKPASGSGQSASLTTDGGGVASGGVPAGTYGLEEVGGGWCLADSSAFDTNARLVVAGNDVAVTIYNCGT